MMPSLSTKLLSVAAAIALTARAAEALDAVAVDNATFDVRAASAGAGPDPFVVKAQTLLDRRSISPGVIDGYDGENYRKAVAQFRRQENLGGDDEVDQAFWSALSARSKGAIIAKYKITEQDIDHDFADSIPSDYAKQARMKRLAYTSSTEMFAERFHMDEDLLKALNPNAAYKAGETILVVSVKRENRRKMCA